jgi:hypothetical protein
MSPCEPGSYSEFKASSCTECPAGYSCASASNPPTHCALGKYSGPGATSCTSCSTSSTPGAVCTAAGILDYCKAGEVCDPSSAKSGSYPTPCPATKKCPTGETSTPADCPVGHYSDVGATACTICPLGKFCPSSSAKSLASMPHDCPDGTFANGLGSSICATCPIGHSCE